MAERSTAATIDAYIAEFPPDVQERLERVRAIVHETEPEAVETISYAVPTFDLDGRHMVHFGGFTHHIGFYPTPGGMTEFADQLSVYKRGKGSANFPLDEPLPEDLIRAIVRYRAGVIRAGGK